LCWQVGFAAASTANPDAFLKQTQDLQLTNHSKYLEQLARLNQQASGLTPDQQWHLRFLNAWEAMYESDYVKSEALLQDIIQHSGYPEWVDRASGLLLSQYGLTRRYTKAFELANRLAARLPQVTDTKIRSTLLVNLSSTLGLAGQADLAVHYAHMAMAAIPAGESACPTMAFLVSALYNSHRLKPDSPELQQALDTCPAAGEPVYHTQLVLTLADLYANGGQPRKALALLDRIEPSLDANGYVPAMLSALVNRAQALAAVGDDDAARNVALAVVTKGKSGEIDAWLKDAYKVLYRVEKKQGHAAAALDYYEKYTELDKAYLDDINARAMAYETVQQHLLAQKLETEKLGQQNEALRLQQKLDAKTAETNRLYLTLLLVVLGFGVIWMFRLKRSQLRFKRLSHLDGLTTTYNRQHFMDEAACTLRLLEKRQGMACLAIIDLDHFKRVNDSHGHAMGDEVLRRTVDASREHLRPIDLFGRLGGEEFGILLVDCSRDQGVAIAERIRAAIEDTEVECDGMVIAISTSIGLAFTHSSGHDLRRLCTDADAALYRAKRGGRNCVMAGESITV
jgi:diguanylate cyclase (GGDEF)-like protein